MIDPRSLFRISTALGCVIAVAVLFNGGCTKDDPGITDPPGGGGTGGTVADSTRLAALDAFETYADALDYTDPNSYTAILQYFQSHPETYEASGMSGPRSLWARFTDGRVFIVSDDLDIPPDSSAPRGGKINLSRPSSSSLNKLPTNTQARFLNALGPAFDPLFGTGATETANDLRDWASSVGYTAPTSGDASVDGLKLVQGDGVFYISSHGSWGRTRDSLNSYGIWTTDEVTPANEVRFSVDLNVSPARLCWYKALDNNSIIGENRRTHYAITPRFVRAYMSFGTNSLVFINACRSDTLVNADFKAACIEKNAGVYMGWSHYVDCQKSLNAARFFFDRLLGTNQQSPAENPRQRPFEITYVLEDMLLRGFDTHSTPDHGPTKLLATPPYGFGGQPTQLAPSIQWAIAPFIPGDVNIFIDGSYGDNPPAGASVTLGGNPLAIASSNSNRIQCPAPASGGNLVVNLNGIKSNTIQLTEWHSQFTLIYRGPQSLQHRVILNLNFWSDVRNWRSLPNKPANFWQARYIYAMANSSCIFESSGQHRSTLDTTIIYETWSDAVTPLFSRTFTASTYFGIAGSLDSIGASSHVTVGFRGKFTRFLNGSGTSDDYFSPPSELAAIVLQMANGHILQAGSIPWSSGDHYGSITWTQMQPTYPPNPNDGR